MPTHSLALPSFSCVFLHLVCCCFSSFPLLSICQPPIRNSAFGLDYSNGKGTSKGSGMLHARVTLAQHSLSLSLCVFVCVCRSLNQHNVDPVSDAKPMSEEDKAFLRGVCQYTKHTWRKSTICALTKSSQFIVCVCVVLMLFSFSYVLFFCSFLYVLLLLYCC